jgi:predicted secreted protein
MSRIVPILLAPALLVLAAPSPAQTTEPRYDQIDLSVSAEREVENDLLTAIVFAEVEDNDQNDAADEVNQAIRWAAERARRVDGITVETGQYSTRPVYAANDRRITGWVARQALTLESRNAETLSELLGTLQERVAIQSIGYGLSKPIRDAAEEALISEALEQFNRRANLIARELGRDGFRIVRLSVGNNIAFRPAMAEMQRMRVESAALAPPELDAGRQTVSVSVSGTVELAAP